MVKAIEVPIAAVTVAGVTVRARSRAGSTGRAVLDAGVEPAEVKALIGAIHDPVELEGLQPALQWWRLTGLTVHDYELEDGKVAVTIELRAFPPAMSA